MSDRAAVITEARTWAGTPWRHRGRSKGKHGGIDCAQFVYAVFRACGLSEEMPLEEYPPDFMLHRGVERLANVVLSETKEVTMPDMADIALFKIGRVFSHAAIVVAWPVVIHSWRAYGCVVEEKIGGALPSYPVRFFSRF
jgi:cell wall-associated NlpC family hydrolase